MPENRLAAGFGAVMAQPVRCAPQFAVLLRSIPWTEIESALDAWPYKRADGVRVKLTHFIGQAETPSQQSPFKDTQPYASTNHLTNDKELSIKIKWRTKWGGEKTINHLNYCFNLKKLGILAERQGFEDI